MSEHTHEQGLRVHHLVNLGGLIAVAGLDREPPDFLLGVLVSAAHEAAALTAEERARVASLGREKLDERVTAKRAWRIVAARPRTSFIAAVERPDATPDRGIGWGRTGEPGRAGGGADGDAGRG